MTARGDGGGWYPPVPLEVLHALIHHPRLQALLANPWLLAIELRRLGCDVPVWSLRMSTQAAREHRDGLVGPTVGLPISEVLAKHRAAERELARAQAASGEPLWLEGLLDRTVPRVVRQVIAVLVATDENGTELGLWDPRGPTIKHRHGLPLRVSQHERRADILFQAAEDANQDVSRISRQDWWAPDWPVPSCPATWPPRERAQWYTGHVKRLLARGLQAAAPDAAAPEAAAPDAAAQPPAAPASLPARRGLTDQRTPSSPDSCPQERRSRRP
jgi:hypothetical protein